MDLVNAVQGHILPLFFFEGQSVPFCITVYALKLPAGVDVIIGTPELDALEVVLNFPLKKVQLGVGCTTAVMDLFTPMELTVAAKCTQHHDIVQLANGLKYSMCRPITKPVPIAIATRDYNPMASATLPPSIGVACSPPTATHEYNPMASAALPPSIGVACTPPTAALPTASVYALQPEQVIPHHAAATTTLMEDLLCHEVSLEDTICSDADLEFNLDDILNADMFM